MTMRRCDDWSVVNLAAAIEVAELPGSGTLGTQVVRVEGRKAHVYAWRGLSITPKPFNGGEFKAWGQWVHIGTMNWQSYLDWRGITA